MCNRSGCMKFSFLCIILEILDKAYCMLWKLKWPFPGLNSCVEQNDNIISYLPVTICFEGFDRLLINFKRFVLVSSCSW